MPRNFNNINHWLAEVRQIAFESKRCRTPDGIPMTQEQINWCFSKNTMVNHFNFKSSPQEAFDDEMLEWENNN